MSAANRNRSRRRTPLGFATLTIRIALLLALIGRPLAFPVAAPLAALFGSGDPLSGFAICHADGTTSDIPPGPSTPSGHDCGLCPIRVWPGSANLAEEPARPTPAAAG